MKRDLTAGNVIKNLLYMAVPTMLGLMSQTLYDLVDMMWVGRISRDAVAAVTIFTAVYWLTFVINNTVDSSSVSLISQSYGAGDSRSTRRIIEQAFTFKFLLAIIAAIGFYFTMEPLMRFYVGSTDVITGAIEYGKIRILFLPIAFSSFTVRTALRSIGDSKSPMKIMIFASILNIILDPILMFERIPVLGVPGLNMGISGAALATAISTTVSFIWGGWLLFFCKNNVQPSIKGLFRLDRETSKRLITVGFPKGVETLLRNVAQVLMLKFVAIFGAAAIATLGIGVKLFAFAFMPLDGLLAGGSAIVGQNLGCGNIKRADQTAKAAAVLGSLVMTAFTVLAVAFPRQIFALFINDTEVFALGTMVLRIATPGLIATGVFLGLATVFMGSGYNLPFLVASIVARWVIQLPFQFITIMLLKKPFIYMVYSFLIAELVEFIIIVGAYIRGRWKTYRAFKPVEEVKEALVESASS